MCHLRLGLALCMIGLLAAELAVDTDQMEEDDDEDTAAVRLDDDNFKFQQWEDKNTSKQVFKRQKRGDYRSEYLCNLFFNRYTTSISYI